MFAHLSAAAAILAMLCAVFKGVIPNLANESPRSRALQSWLDIWVPLILALPIAAVPLLPGAGDAPSSLLLSSQGVIPVALAGLLVGAALSDRRVTLRIRCIDGHHVMALAVLGILFVGASYVGRMADWNGHLLLTAAMLWLWTVSAEPTKAAASQAENDPLFLVDWTGPLSHPVDPVTQGVLLLCPALLLFAILSPLIPQISHSAAMCGPSMPTLLVVALMVPTVQIAVLAGVWRRVGPAGAIRCAISTIILTLLMGIGVLCIRLIPWGAMLMSVKSGDEASYTITDLTGISMLFPVAMLVLTLALVGLTPRMTRPALPPLGWGIIAVSVISLGVGLLVLARHWPSAPVAIPAPVLRSPASAQSRVISPDSLITTFLQDDPI